MPKPVGYTSKSWLLNKGGGQFTSIPVVGLELPIHTADQLSTRDQQWIEMVRPVVEALERYVTQDQLHRVTENNLYRTAVAVLSQIKGE